MPNGELPNTKSGYTKKTTMLLYSASVTCLLYKPVGGISLAHI